MHLLFHSLLLFGCFSMLFVGTLAYSVLVIYEAQCKTAKARKEKVELQTRSFGVLYASLNE